MRDFCIDFVIWDSCCILSLAVKSENCAWQGEDSGLESAELYLRTKGRSEDLEFPLRDELV